MFASLFAKRYANETLLCLYIQPEGPFDEIEDFIRECQQRYQIQVETIRGTVKASLFDICQRYPYVKAVVMGCRRTDPYCTDLNAFQVILCLCNLWNNNSGQNILVPVFIYFFL